MGNKHLSEVISYEKDIAPYPFIQIYSGVGSGKNYFINQLINGYTETRTDGSTYEVPPHRVLCITSRRAKVNETQNDNNVSVGIYVDEWINGCQVEDIEEYIKSQITLSDDRSWGDQLIHQRSIVCTNAAIEKYLENHYNPANISTHLWQRFDIIVLDEAHSVLSDASYQTAPFYVHKFINEVSKRNQCGETTCKTIVMTGTPGIIKNFSLPKHAHEINVLNECINIAPPNIAFISSEDARTDLLSRFHKGQKAVYFANHIAKLFSLHEDFTPAEQKHIALSFSNKDRLDFSKPEHTAIAQQMYTTQERIAKEQQLPDNIQLFITTSRNKEGINLLNRDVKVMYVEAHSEVDIIQMAGRIRYGLDILYIITDSPAHPDTENQWEYDFTIYEKLENCANDFLHKLCAQKEIHLDVKDNEDTFFRKNISNYPVLSEFIEYIHTKYPYLRFNYLKDKFEIYKNRKISKKYYQDQEHLFSIAKKSEKELEALVKTWYPNAKVSFIDIKRQKITDFLTEKQFINTPLDQSQLVCIREFLISVVGKTFSSLNPVLKPYGFCVVKASGNRASVNYDKKKIILLQD